MSEKNKKTETPEKKSPSSPKRKVRCKVVCRNEDFVKNGEISIRVNGKKNTFKENEEVELNAGEISFLKNSQSQKLVAPKDARSNTADFEVVMKKNFEVITL